MDSLNLSRKRFRLNTDTSELFIETQNKRSTSSLETDSRLSIKAQATLTTYSAGLEPLLPLFTHTVTTSSIDAAQNAQEITYASRFLENSEGVDDRDEMGNTGLMRALHTGNREALEIYCKAGSDLDRCEEDGFTPLMLAACKGDLTSMKILLHYGTDVHSVDDRGLIALDYLERTTAFRFNNPDTHLCPFLKKILIQKVCDFYEIDVEGYEKAREEFFNWMSAQEIPHASEYARNSQEVYKWVYNHILTGQRTNPYLDQHVHPQFTFQEIKELLAFCNKVYSKKLIKKMLKEGSDLVNAWNWHSSLLVLAMHCKHKIGTLAGLPHIVHSLIKANADIEADNNTEKKRPLMEAAQEGQDSIVQLLLEAKANQNAQNAQGSTALMLAISYRQSTVIEILVNHRGSNHHLQDDAGNTALILATLCDDRGPAIIKQLLYLGTAIDAQNQEGETALMVAASLNNPEVVKLLLHPPLGANTPPANMEMRDTKGNTALMKVADGWHIENSVIIMNHLLAAGAEKEVRNDHGYTALMVAIANDYLPCIKCLLDAGANVYAIHPKTGESPILYTQKGSAVEGLLLNQGVSRAMAKRVRDWVQAHQNIYDSNWTLDPAYTYHVILDRIHRRSILGEDPS